MKSNWLFFIYLLLLTGCVENYNGANVYKAQCANCHGANGGGLKKVIPAIAGSDYFFQNKNKLACIIRNGLKDSIVVNGVLFHSLMPGNKNLTETDIANLINYINKKWYPGHAFVDPGKVKAQLKNCND